MEVKVKFNDINVKEEKEKTLVKVLMLKGEKGDSVSAEWGTITGNLEDQTDLKNALDSKANQSSLDTTNQNVSNLQTAVNSKASQNDLNITNQNVSEVNTKTEKKPYYYNTLNDLKNDLDLKDGDCAITLGYYEPNDGGAGTYEIVTGDLTDDGGNIHGLNNGLFAKLVIENDTINIKQFGAYGNGEHDDTQAIKTAFEFNQNKNLKIVFNKDGIYLVGETIYLYSNKEIDLNNSTLKANSYLKFYNNVASLNLIGYGALKNISFKNGTIDGSALGVTFGILHGENLNIENIKFLDCCATTHIFDLGGCKNVNFKNCNFTGSYISNSSTLYREMIQPDYATYIGLPYWDSSDYAGYDGLPTINLTVDGCNFEKGNGTHCPNAVGTHAVYGDLALKNIKIINNTFHDSTAYTLRFPRVQNLVIDNNIFYNDEEKTYTDTSTYINLYAINSSEVNQENSKDIRISNNTFYKEVETHLTDVIRVVGLQDYLIENVLIENNVYYGNYDKENNTSVADFLLYSNIKNLTISNNVINKAKNTFIRRTDENYVYKINIFNNRLINCRQLFRFQVEFNDIKEYNLKNNIIATDGGFINDSGDVSIFGVSEDHTAVSEESRLIIDNAKRTNGLIALGTSNSIIFNAQVMKYKVYGNITIQNNNNVDENYNLDLKQYVGTTYLVNRINMTIKAGETKTIIIPTTYVEIPTLVKLQNEQYFWITPGLKANDKIIAAKTNIFIETC